MKYVASLIEHLIDFLFGCHHDNRSRVFTINRHTYCVCCDCGAEFDYSWETMSTKSKDMSQNWTLAGTQMKNVAQGT